MPRYFEIKLLETKTNENKLILKTIRKKKHLQENKNQNDCKFNRMLKPSKASITFLKY